MQLVVFSHLRWDFVYQRPQHLLSRLARRMPVVFVEEPVPADIAGIVVGTPAPGVTVVKPRTPVGAAGFHEAQVPHLVPLLTEYLAAQGATRYIAWLYTPMALPLAQQLAPHGVVFDCMDELSAFKGAPPALQHHEAALLATADLVFAGGVSLYEAKRRHHPGVVCLPSGVDAEHYAPESLDIHGAPARQVADAQGDIAKPRLGYFGVIDERLDIALLAQLADADPQWQIVMVGPVVKIDPQDLPQRPNIHWLGQQPYEALPHFVAGWDVCLLPFAINEATRYISPTKTVEYMAAGKPIVSTAVHDVVASHARTVAIARDAGEFVAACRAALEEDPATRRRRLAAMRETVATSSWDAAAARVAGAIDDMLSSRSRSARVATAAARDDSATVS